MQKTKLCIVHCALFIISAFCIIISAFLFSGCATKDYTPKDGVPQKKEQKAPTLSVPTKRIAPTITFFRGDNRVRVNGILVWLNDPPTLIEGILQPSWTDKKYIIEPLTNARSTPFLNRPARIILDPGHGGSDPGAVSLDQSVRESQLVLDIAKRTATLLQQKGYTVFLTRENDTYSTPEHRPRIARQLGADLFVSIHVNSAATPAGSSGVETYYLAPTGVIATTHVGQELSEAAKNSIKRTYPGHAHHEENLPLAYSVHRSILGATGFTDRGIKSARFAVLRDITMPAILIETGFLSNPSDRAMLTSPNGRDRIAQGISDGIHIFATGTIWGVPVK